MISELGGAVQLMGILRVLIDPENMLATANVSICISCLTSMGKNWYGQSNCGNYKSTV